MGTDTFSRRNQSLMCWRCRHDKRKCTPVDRDWDNLKQKCERCSRLQYECGAPERAQRRPRKRRSTVSIAPDQGCRRNTCVSFNMSGSSARHDDLRATRSPSPIASQSIGVSSESMLDTCATPDFDFARASHLSRSRFDNDLTRLGDLYATRELLRWDLALCDQVEEWLGFSDHLAMVKEAIQGIINAVQEDFEERVKKTRYTLVRNGEPATDQIMLQLYLIAYKFVNPPPSSVSVKSGNESNSGTGERSSLQQMGHTLHQNTLAYSDAEYICGAFWDQSQCHYQPSKTPRKWIAKCFYNASAAIASILSDIVPRKFEHRELLFGHSTGVDSTTDDMPGYPVEHLAVMYGSPFLSLEFWGKSAIKFGKVDCLQRASVHTAVYAGKLHELKCIIEHDSKAIRKTSRDIFGLTPLMIAACKDDVKIATLLLKYGADDKVRDNAGRSILTLALQNDSHSIVKLLECHGHILDLLPGTQVEPFGALKGWQNQSGQSLVSHCIKHESTNGPDPWRSRADVTTLRQNSLQNVLMIQENSAVCPFRGYSTTCVCDETHSSNSGSSSSRAGEQGAIEGLSASDVPNFKNYCKAIDLLRNLPGRCKQHILEQTRLVLEETMSEADLPNHLSLLSRCLDTSPEPFQTDHSDSIFLPLQGNWANKSTNTSKFTEDEIENYISCEPWYGIDSVLLECPDLPYEMMEMSAMT